MSDCVNSKVLEVRVDRLEKDVEQLQQDTKDNKTLLHQYIGELKESNARISTFIETLTIQIQKQDERMEKQDQIIAEIGKDVTYMRHTIDSQPQDETGIKWYQEMLSNNNKWIWYVLLLLLGTLLGLNASDIAGFIGK